MMPRSVRGNVTAWYLVMLTIASAALVAGGWALLSMNMRGASDRALLAQLDGVRQFIANVQHITDPEHIRDEFGEYAQLTMGESLLEVIDPAGDPLCRPGVPWWPALAGDPMRRLDNAVPVIAARTADGRPFRVAAVAMRVDGSTYRVTIAIGMQPYYSDLTRFGILLAVIVPALLGLAAAGGYWISGRALQPVDRMTRTAQAITLRSLDRRIEVPAVDDELRRLAVTFNDMLARLELAVADVVRFTAEASHELRTPVSLIRTSAEIALERERAPAEYQHTLAEIVAETEGMSRLVDDLLALARADAGVDEDEPDVGDLALVTRQAIRAITPVAERGGVTIDARIPDAPLLVCGRPQSLSRVALILLDNSVKYSPRGGVVRVHVRVADALQGVGAQASIVVSDSGPGIDTIDAPQVFDRFYRGQAARASSVDGHGLGLSIARTIVDRLKGTIAINERDDVPGCEMEVRLPVAHGARAGEAPQPAGQSSLQST